MVVNRSVPALVPMTPLLALAALPALLGGCAGAREPYPSLAHRAVEDRAIGAAEQAEAPSPVELVADPALDAQAARELQAAEQAARAFGALLAATRSAVAAATGAAPGEERWVVAQQAVSRLDQARSPVPIAVAALDRLRIDAANRAPPVDTARLDAAWQRATAIQTELDATFRPLAEALPTG